MKINAMNHVKFAHNDVTGSVTFVKIDVMGSVTFVKIGQTGSVTFVKIVMTGSSESVATDVQTFGEDRRRMRIGSNRKWTEV